MNKYNLQDVKNRLGFTLVGEYLKGAAGNNYIPKDADPYKLGLEVMGESYDFSNSFADERYRTPFRSMGALNTLIVSCGEKLDRQFERIDMQSLYYSQGNRLESFMETYLDTMYKAARPIAFAEGEADDDLKQDIKVLIREGKEEFEKRVEENEATKKEEAEEIQADTEGQENQFDTGDDAEGSDEFGGEDSGDEFGGDDFGSDDSGDDFGGDEENSDEFGGDSESEGDGDEFGSDDSGDEFGGSDGSDEIPDGNLSQEGDDEFGDGDDEEESDDGGNEFGEEESENDQEAVEESFSIWNVHTKKVLRDYNNQVAFAEDRKFYHNGQISNIPVYDLKGMTNKLLQYEKESFTAIGESFKVGEINNDHMIQKAHKDYVNTMAAVLCLRHKLGKYE